VETDGWNHMIDLCLARRFIEEGLKKWYKNENTKGFQALPFNCAMEHLVYKKCFDFR